MSTRKPATRADVARVAGTSVAVVSYVVNGGPRPVAEHTRERVLQAIDAVGYRPNFIAQALASGVSGAYGLVVPDISNAFFSTLAHRLFDAVAGSGKVLLLGDAAENKTRENRLVSMFVQRNIDGLLFIGVDNTPDLHVALDDGVPVVMLDRVDESRPLSSIAIDNFSAAREATAHLIGHGHTRIALVAGPSELSTADDRAAGWERALTDAGLPIRADWRFKAPFSRNGGLDAASSLFDLNDRPDAVFASNEQQAVGIHAAAARRGLSIPGDLAVITVDGTEDSEFTHPAISTVVQPLDEIAHKAFDLLTSKTIAHETCAHALRLRGSCGTHSSNGTR